jgi:hypothetical protein
MTSSTGFLAQPLPQLPLAERLNPPSLRRTGDEDRPMSQAVLCRSLDMKRAVLRDEHSLRLFHTKMWSQRPAVPPSSIDPAIAALSLELESTLPSAPTGSSTVVGTIVVVLFAILLATRLTPMHERPI